MSALAGKAGHDFAGRVTPAKSDATDGRHSMTTVAAPNSWVQGTR